MAKTLTAEERALAADLGNRFPAVFGRTPQERAQATERLLGLLQQQNGPILGAQGDALQRMARLGVYILPTENGHTPDLSAPGVGEFYRDLGLPCIVGSQVLYARRELAGGHSARAVWAPIQSNQGNASVGEEIVTAAAVGQMVQVGDRRSVTASGTTTYYVANRAFTILAGDVADGLPGEDAATGWDVSTQLDFSVTGFRGVVTNPSQVSSPVDGQWVYDILEGVAYGSRYSAGDGVWHGFTPGADENIRNNLGVFANNDEALEAVHFFEAGDRSSETVAIIDGQLNVLTYWDPPEPGDAEYHWRSRGTKATAPLLVGTTAAGTGTGRTNDSWIAVGSDVYKTLLELGAQWVYIEITIGGTTNPSIITFPLIRVGSLREISGMAGEDPPTGKDTYLNGATFATTRVGGHDTTSALRGALSYDGDDLQIRLEDAGSAQGTIDAYAIR